MTAKTKAPSFPLTVSRYGVHAKIYRKVRLKNDRPYVSFEVAYNLHGKRHFKSFTDLKMAKDIAVDACAEIARGEADKLTLTNSKLHAYKRALEALEPLGEALDDVVREYVHARGLLKGKATIAEVCRDWLTRRAEPVEDVSVLQSCRELLEYARQDGKSKQRLKQLSTILESWGSAHGGQVAWVTPDHISKYLVQLKRSERTRRNYRDVLAYWNKFCVLRGYLPKGTNLLENVQTYSAKKQAAIHIFSPQEMGALLEHADRKLVPYLAIAAFTGLRATAIAKLDWSRVDLADGWIEIVEGSDKTKVRHLAAIPPNLKSWLEPLAKRSGKVCPYLNVTKQLLKTAEAAGVKWHRNGLRNSGISYLIAQSGDIARTAYQCGTSPRVVETNYLRRVKPAVAKEWFSIAPAQQGKVIKVG